MERTKGGYIILDLSSLPLAETEEATEISSDDILKQLLSLSDYALHPERALKPIYLRAIDSNGVEVVSLCELDRNNGALRIKALVMDVILAVYVTYDIDGDTQEIYIDSAGYEVISEANRILKEVESAEEGSIDKVLGLDASGGLVKGTISGGTKLYRHEIKFIDVQSRNYTLEVITTDENEITSTSMSNIPYLLTYVYFMNYMGSKFSVSGFSFIGSAYRIYYYDTKNDGTDDVFIKKSQDLNQNIVSDTVTPL